MASPGPNDSMEHIFSGLDAKRNEDNDNGQQLDASTSSRTGTSHEGDKGVRHQKRSSQILHVEFDVEDNAGKTQQAKESSLSLTSSKTSAAPLRLPPIKVTPSGTVSTAGQPLKKSIDTSGTLLPRRSNTSLSTDIRKSIIKTATKERQETRFAWATNFDFSMVSMACVIGIHNFVRFPQLCKKYGGLAFLVPYLVVVICMGLPLYFLETLLGQYSGHGTVAVMNELVPAFVGIGYALVINNFLEFMRNEMDVARFVFMTVSTMQTKIPWAVCDETNSVGCYTREDDIYCKKYGTEYVFYNLTCTRVSDICERKLGAMSTGEYCRLGNGSTLHYDKVIVRSTPELEFYFHEVLDLEGATLSHLGPIHWPMFFCLAFCWSMTYLLGYNGFSTTAKSAYLTTFAPLLGQFMVYIRAFCLTGAGDGIMTYLTFDPSSLKTKEVWLDAIKTCFSSESLGLGLLTAISSASKPYKNCLKTSLAIICLDTFISMLSGLGFFAIMGHLAHSVGMTVGELMAEESNIMFSALPSTLTSLSFPRIYVAVSYASTALMSFGYLAAVIGMTTYDGKDIFNSLTNHSGNTEKAASNLSIYQYNLVTCILGFTSSVLFVAKGGTLVLRVTDLAGHVDMSFVIAALQTIVICFFYGSGSILDLVEEEMGMHLGRSRLYWAVTWNVVAPVLLLWAAFSGQSPEHLDTLLNEDDGDAWHTFGGVLAFYPLLVVLGFFVFQLYNYRKESVWMALQPTRKWCLGLDTTLILDAAEAEPELWQEDMEIAMAAPSQLATPAASVVVTMPSANRVDSAHAPDAPSEKMHRLTIAPSGAPAFLVPHEGERSKSIFEGPAATAFFDHTLRSHSYVPFQRQMEEGKRIRRLSAKPT